MRKITAFLLPLLASAAPLDLVTLETPPADSIKILDSATSGNGCPQGTVSTTVSPDRTVITFGFDAFQVYIGPGTQLSDRSKNCAIHLSLGYPGGFQYAILEATYHGYARLDQGVTGAFYSQYFFSQDASKSTTTKSNVSGSQWVNGNIYTKNDKVENTAIIWSPCGDTGILNINNRIALTATNSTLSGELSDDDATVAFTEQVHISWRPCTSNQGASGGSDWNLDSKISTFTSDPEWDE